MIHPAGILLVGMGRMGRHHLRAIEACQHTRCVGVCDLAPHASPEGLPHWQDLGQALEASTAQAVLLSVPPEAHERLARQCLEAGLPVLLEKPLTPSWSTSRALAEAFKARGIALCPAMVERFNPAWRTAVDLVPALGRLRRITIVRTSLGPGPGHTTDVGLDLAIHDLDLLAGILQDLHPVRRQAAKDSLRMRWNGPQGTLVELTAAWNAPTSRREWQLDGSLGRLRIDFQRHTVQLDAHEIRVPAQDALEAQLSDFVQCIEDRARIDLDTALRAQAWLEAPIHATASISTFTSRGRRPTSIVERAGA